MKKALFFLLISLVAVTIFAQQYVSAPQKFALVIGNSNYSGISRLNNPANDANDMEDALRALGFNVEKVIDGSRQQMENAVIQLKQNLSRQNNTYGFFFYAGHGVQSNGENYLIPVNADISSENSLRDRAVSLNWILAEFKDARNAFNFIVLDSCRDNPFSWNRSGTRGLTVVSHAPQGSIIFYATSDGRPAQDGTGRNGLFTAQLLINLRTHDLEITEVIRRTGAAVSQASGGTQIPAVYNQFFATAYLGSQPSPNPSPSPAPSPTPQPAPVPSFLVHIQGGTFTMGSPASQIARNYDEIQHQVTVSSFYMGKFEVRQREYIEIMGTNPSSFTGDLNRPVELVSWFDAVEYCNRLSQREGLTPAYMISGSENNRTVTWNRSANGYRLPTEAEWEYACRAGTATPFNTGNNITTSQANYNGYPYNNNAIGEDRQRTTPAGSFPPNAWGLYDMHGNVSEWCWDWYGDYASEAQNNPTGSAYGSYRVLRGGNWFSAAQSLRSASRGSNFPDYVFYTSGFRIARNAE